MRINEGSIKTRNNFCQNPEDFPLFGINSCISPALYTGLFLTSIILAGITFLILIILLFLFSRRRLIRSKSDYNADLVNPTNNNLKPMTSAPKSDKQISNVLRKIINNTQLNGLPQSHIHHSLPIPTIQESLVSSSNSFGDSYSRIDEQSKPKNIIPTISESYESSSDESYDDYKRKYSTKL